VKPKAPITWAPLAALLLAGCVQPPEVARRSAPADIATRAEAPPEAAPGTCWGKEAEPPETRAVIEPVMVQPAQLGSDGTVLSPPIYRREPQQRIVRQGRETWFETPCPEALTPEFVSSVQRALAARDLYDGPITGEMDAPTSRAIRSFQEPLGLPSGTLSLTAARQLGLAPAILPETGDS